MKFFSANIASLPDMYTTELAKALDLEETLLKVLPKMTERANDPQLQQLLQIHLMETQRHVMRVKRLLRDQSSKTCKVMRALASEAENVMSGVAGSQALDIALISAAQRVEHYEIAVYGALKGWARQLGRATDVAILSSIENDEKHAGGTLTSISSRLNGLTAAMAA